MAIADDFSVNASGDIRYVGDAHGGGSPGYYTVIELHRWLQDLADDAVAGGNDLVDITDLDPSQRSTDNIITLINGYNIDDTAAEHLYDGSIIQAGGDTIYDGIVNFGNASFIMIIQNGALIANDFWNSFSPSGFNFDSNQGISHRFLVKVRTGGTDTDGRRLLGMVREFNKTYAEFPINGTSRGNNVLALSESDDLNNATAAATVATWSDVVNDNEGYTLIDVNNDTTTEPYYSNWEFGSRSVNDFYERMKWLTRQGSASTIYGLSGEIFRGITHEINVDTPTGTFVEPESVSWTGGTGQLLAIDSTTAPTKMWIQLLTGVAPTDGQTITGNGGATADVNVTVTLRTVPIPFVGQSTGSALIGAYGLGIGTDDLTASDLLFDLTDTQRQPPNNVTFTVGGLIHGEDRILVGPESGGALQTAQFTVATTALTTANITAVTINTTIPLDTPNTGTIRVFDNDGVARRLIYTSYTGSTFTIDPSASEADVPNVADFDTVNANIGNSVFISYIDDLAVGATVNAGSFTVSETYVIDTVGTTDFTLIGASANTPGIIFTATGVGSGTGTAFAYSTQASFTGVYQSDRSLFIRVRDGASTPIKGFETTGTLGSAGGSTTAIRTADT